MNFSPTFLASRIFLAAFVPALFQAWAAPLAMAETASAWAKTPQSAARLISAVTAMGELQRLPLGLEFTMKPGWKTYWRSPGDAGLPAQIELAGSSNAGAAQLRWPVPQRFELFGLQTFGYGDHVVLPLDVAVPRPGEAAALRVQLRYLVCEVICIPVDADLSLDLPAGPALPSGEAPLISRFASQVPMGPERLGWRIEGPAIDEEGAIVIDLASTLDPLVAPDVIIEGSPTHVFRPPKLELAGNTRDARLTVPAIRVADGPELSAQDLTFTIFDGVISMEMKARPGESMRGAILLGAQAKALPATGLLAILGVALLGGLILNIMPCVLPVLALKVTGVLEMSGQESRRTRISFLASAAGILVSFLALAGALGLAKASGASVGWGIQFQQPLFLAAMALVCLAFAANLFGWFQIPMPAFVGWASVAGEGRLAGDHSKAFFSGVLATALATPCSAPFVGTAVGFALSRGAAEILLIFASLGLGLAAPYLAIAVAPGMVGLLPRPGPWMRWVKRILGISLLATAIWLASVIGGQMGWTKSWWVGSQQGPWIAFDEKRIALLVGEDKLVFVDVTADWCLTCQANKKLVLNRDPVGQRLRAPRMVAMLADWTNPDPAISGFLARFARYGIPFNVVFGPKAPEGVVLPELLTTDAVMRAIGQAGG